MYRILISVFLITGSSLAVKEEFDDYDVLDVVNKAVKEVKARRLQEAKGHFSHLAILQRSSSVCYGELGCFDKNGTFSFLKQLPEPPETVNTKFLLYTRKNFMEPQFLDYNKPETILNSNINPKLPVKFITHGFGGKNNLTWIWEMKTAFLEKEDLNIIAIDWSLGARVPYYPQSVVNTELVGAWATQLFFFLKDKMGVHEKDLHVIGFSLGAHVSGFVGKKMTEWRGIRPGRITGLDPAGPLFEDQDETVHLNKNDADYVDIIHTNCDSKIYAGMGIVKPIGHVDFYPNGGKRQPGCDSTLIGALKDIVKNKKHRNCNHERAVWLFIDSIRAETPCDFTSYQCPSYDEFQEAKCLSCEKQCGRMGYKSHGSGVYYLLTKEEAPFCTEIVKLKVNYSTMKSYGTLILTLVSHAGKKMNITLTESKSEKLSPGAGKIIVIHTNDIIKDLSAVQSLYIKYRGLITKGKETFALASVTLEDSEGQFLFKSCDEVTLKDLEYQTLKQTDKSC